MGIIELFKTLLRFKSITPNDDGAFEFIRSYLGSDWQEIVLNKEGVKNSLFYKKFGSGEHLCFAGHIDVVPVGEGWSCDPFEAFENGDEIIARGAQDMKSGVAAFLHACKNATNFSGTLSILLTSDEEGDGVFGTRIMLEHLKEIDFLPDFAIVAEPTCEEVFGDAIKVGRRGSINGVLELFGKQGHAAYPEKSINPVELIAPILPQIAGINLDDGDEYFSASKLVITDIRAGMEVTNVTPGKLKMMFNVRNSTKTDTQKVQDFINSKFDGLDFTLKLNGNTKPFVTDKNSKIVQVLSDAVFENLQIRPKNSTAGGTSDARFFGILQIPTVEFGVINDTIHSVNERTSKTEVKALAEIFETVIENF